ncbi:MAG: M43 family zinc metalloprotease [Bacteroidota bacterium]
MKNSIYIFAVLTFFVKTCYSQLFYPWCNYDEYVTNFKQSNLGFNDSIDNLVIKSQQFKTSNADPNHTIWIPVVFHVVYNPALPAQNISDAQIQSQLAILNSRFSNSNAHVNGVDTKIQFCFAKTNPFNQPTTGVTRFSVAQNQFYINTFNYGDERPSLTAIDKWPSDKYLNIWIANTLQEVKDNVTNIYYIQDLSGQSSIPIFGYSLPDDGIILNYKYVGNIGTASIPGFDKGTTLVHEVGHWLGLFHTFQIYPNQPSTCANVLCNNVGDRICDTEPVDVPAIADSYNVNIDPTKRKDCNQNIVSAENYMDYNFNQYNNFFTSDQKDRMRFSLSYYRNYFYQNSLNNPGALAIECSNPSGSSNNPVIPSTSGCSNNKYPDEWMMLNGNTNSFVELCEYTQPVIRVSTPSICNKFPLWKMDIECNSQSLFEGTCNNIFGNPKPEGCDWLCRLAGSCACYEEKRKVWFSVRASCDDNFNCPDEIGRWKLLDQNYPVTFNVGQQVFDFNFFSPLQLAGNRKYIIKLATFDDQGNWREGQKFLTFIKDDYYVPVLINNVPNVLTAPKTIKATNSITFWQSTNIPTNSLYEAGQEIRIADEAGSNGNLIESQFKISPISCVNIAGRLSNSDTLNSKNTTVKNTSAQIISNEEIKSFFNSKNLIENDSFDIAVFPNPSPNGIFNYKIINSNSDNENTVVNIYNAQMKLIKNQQSELKIIDLKNYPFGIYFLEFKVGQKNKFIKIVK